MVDLPDPERPTRATVFPAGTLKEILFNASSSFPGYVKLTFLNSNSPFAGSA